jgi:lipopolysaccharide heptosyltransferase II
MRQENLERILVVNPYGIGDVLFTTPLISNLRKQFPNAYIGALLGSRTKEILEDNSDIDEIFVFDKGKFDNLPKHKRFCQLHKLIRSLRQRKFNLLIDLSNSSQYGFIGKFFLKIPKRIGLNYKNRGRFLTDKIELKGYCGKHVAEFYLDLLRLLEITPENKSLKFSVKEEDKSWAKKTLKDKQISEDDLVIGVVPGGGSSWGPCAIYKHWDKKKFAQLSDRLTEEYKAKVIILGSKSEVPICRYILSRMQKSAFSMCGMTSLGQFASLVGLCDLIVCNDGGPLHVAVTQGTPTVSIFGPVDEKVYGPYPKEKNHYVIKKDLACRPCYQDFKFIPCKTRECLNLIGVDEVLDKVRLLIKDKV